MNFKRSLNSIVTENSFRIAVRKEPTLEDSIGEEYSKLQERIHTAELKHGEFIIDANALRQQTSGNAVAAAQREDMINGMNRLNKKIADLLIKGSKE